MLQIVHPPMVARCNRNNGKRFQHKIIRKINNKHKQNLYRHKDKSNVLSDSFHIIILSKVTWFGSLYKIYHAIELTKS